MVRKLKLVEKVKLNNKNQNKTRKTVNKLSKIKDSLKKKTERITIQEFHVIKTMKMKLTPTKS